MNKTTVDSLVESLKQKGFRVTAARRGMLEVFLSHHVPQTASELIEKLEQKKIAADKTTVYREVAFLVEQGIVRDVDFGDGQKRYERADEHHHHLICSNCQSVEDIEVDKDIGRIERAIAKRTKFVIQRHLFEFFGLCQRCA
ncbi:MAG: Fur family transcriptional regulator [Patescibacteria group bacterium]